MREVVLYLDQKKLRKKLENENSHGKVRESNGKYTKTHEILLIVKFLPFLLRRSFFLFFLFFY